MTGDYSFCKVNCVGVSLLLQFLPRSYLERNSEETEDDVLDRIVNTYRKEKRNSVVHMQGEENCVSVPPPEKTLK
jgi:hypothetical protein